MQKNRDPKLDLIRTIAILMISLNHAISAIYVDQINYELFNEVSIYSQTFMVISYIISRLGVPLFLFLTGALVLNKKFDSIEDVKKFYKNNLLSLFVTIELWNIIYYFINMFVTKDSFIVSDLIQILTFTKRSVFGHMWYMPMILGMYLFIPFVSLIVKKYRFKNLVIPATLIILYSFIIGYTNFVLTTEGIDLSLNGFLDLSFGGATYGMYIILGYYIYNKKSFSNINNTVLILLSIVSFILCCVYQAYLYINEAGIIVYYNFIGVLLFTTCIFILLLKLNTKELKITKYLSKNSLAIFYVHFPILFIMEKYIQLSISRPIQVIIFYVVVLIISIILIELLKMIKPIKKYLLRQQS